jgi:hypothetical protein
MREEKQYNDRYLQHAEINKKLHYISSSENKEGT